MKNLLVWFLFPLFLRNTSGATVTAQLNGSNICTYKNCVVHYYWTGIKLPAPVHISSQYVSNPAITFSSVGTYKFRLLVWNNYGKTASDTVVITVNYRSL